MSGRAPGNTAPFLGDKGNPAPMATIRQVSLALEFRREQDRAIF
jgi:hypothetical protein